MTLLTISCSAFDCYSSQRDGALYTGTTYAYVAGSPSSSDYTRVWMPFLVGVPKMTIISATLRVVASANGNTSGTHEFKVHGSPEDNAVNPSTYADLSGKGGTTAEINPAGFPSSVGVEYAYDVTAIVQEILNRAGWANGNNLAIMMTTTAYDSTKHCEIAMVEHATYAEPKLDLVYNRFTPRGGMV